MGSRLHLLREHIIYIYIYIPSKHCKFALAVVAASDDIVWTCGSECLWSRYMILNDSRLTTAVHGEFCETLAVTVQREKFEFWLDDLPIFGMRSNPHSMLCSLEGQSHSYKRLHMARRAKQCSRSYTYGELQRKLEAFCRSMPVINHVSCFELKQVTLDHRLGSAGLHLNVASCADGLHVDRQARGSTVQQKLRIVT